MTNLNHILFLSMLEGCTATLTQGENAYWALPGPTSHMLGLDREQMGELLDTGLVKRVAIGEVMLSDTGRVLLEKHRDLLEHLYPDKVMVRAFERVMEGRQYGEDETRDAKAWFREGWNAAHQDKTNTYLIMYDEPVLMRPTFLNNVPWHIARNLYEQKSVQWNAHLYVKIDSNSRDAYPKDTL